MSENQYDVAIIGAGVAGLTAALKLSNSGKKVVLFERQPIPGGYATSFKRKGFTFESSLHCVGELGIEGDVRKFLKENGIENQVEFINLKEFSRIIFPEHDYVLDFNCGNFITFLKTQFPAETQNIDSFFKSADKFYKQVDHISDSEFPMWFKLLLTPFIYPLIIKNSIFTIEGLLGRYFKDQKLKSIIAELWRFSGLPPSELCAFYFLMVLRGYYYAPTCYVKGSFLNLFNAMVNQIRKTGSEVRFNTTVKTITTHKGRKVNSVITDNGEEFKAKVVISNANAMDTLTKLVDNDYLKEKYRKKLSGLENSISAIQLYLGLKVPAKSLGMSHYYLSLNTTYDANQAFVFSLAGDYQHCQLCMVDHSQIDPGLVPAGKGSLIVMSLDSYANWKNLNEDEYRAKKKEVSEALIKSAEKYLPGLSENIEVMELATPRTMQRFTLSSEGAIYGFAQTPLQASINRLAQNTKVKGLFLTGAWTRPGHGFVGCFISGTDAAERVLDFLK